jgi:hypothetical protein
MYRNLHKPANNQPPQASLSFIITSTGETRIVRQVLSSMPKSDLITMELLPSNNPDQSKLRSLPISPFPVYPGSPVLTHLFGASHPPEVTRSASRLPKGVKAMRDQELQTAELPINWLQGRAWRRWGSGVMLGYRSYTGIEVEVSPLTTLTWYFPLLTKRQAGIHSSLPHILTSILPTPGSSGGPLICAETGAVVGMISGRRMDNRVEGERGWGASAEGIFEVNYPSITCIFNIPELIKLPIQMFSLPGFTPTNRSN